MYHQLKSAVDRGANQIRVIKRWRYQADGDSPNLYNVFGMEHPLHFRGQSPQFYQAFAEREFGYELGHEIGDLLLGHDRLFALRRHEHIEPDTFSIINYSEDYYVERRWLNLEEKGTKICNLVQNVQNMHSFSWSYTQ
jgi:hypothetical protein